MSLDADLLESLQQAAQRRGVSVEEFAVQGLSEYSAGEEARREKAARLRESMKKGLYDLAGGLDFDRDETHSR